MQNCQQNIIVEVDWTHNKRLRVCIGLGYVIKHYVTQRTPKYSQRQWKKNIVVYGNFARRLGLSWSDLFLLGKFRWGSPLLPTLVCWICENCLPRSSRYKYFSLFIFTCQLEDVPTGVTTCSYMCTNKVSDARSFVPKPITNWISDAFREVLPQKFCDDAQGYLFLTIYSV